MAVRKVGLEDVYRVIQDRRGADPSRSYVATLFQRGEDAMLKKLAEECAEVLLAAKSRERPEALKEVADLVFHLLVWMAQAGITPEDVEEELGARFGHSGLRGVAASATPEEP